ncbi:MAG TPA: GDSL-type esterase/lipase family protein [Blastocatellia bacterium]|nr:GDSL-type esterase/lipase family protein [Blastocatellia bacterium]
MEKKEQVIASKTARTLALFVALTVLPYVVPGMGNLRLLPTALLGPFIVGAGDGSGTPEPLHDPETAVDDSPANRPGSSYPGEIEDPSGRALDHFFKALERTETEVAQTRICHYGDSPITNDGITSTVRRKLQMRFGDGGHGFILIAKPWGWYSHSAITHEAGSGWESDPIAISRGDRLYGLGGVSFTASRASVTASFGTAEEGETGRAITSFKIYYLQQPGGGDFEVYIDGTLYGQVSSAADETRSAFFTIDVPNGPHKMTLKTAGNGEVRLFGVVLENGEGGVQYDSLGVNGAYIGLLANYIEAEHWSEQLRFRKPDLVIIGYGANESQFERLPMDQYERDTKEVIRRIRAALLDASILFIGPMDRGARGPGGAIITRPMIPRLISYQRRIAAETGCAFFDTFTAMGGEGTVARWYEARPRLMGGDFTHPTAQGAEIVGAFIYNALVEAYERHKQEIR